VSPELVQVLERARYYAELSGGAFDPTIGPLVKLWNIGSERPRVPREGEIREKLALVNWRDLVLDRKAGTAFLARRGMSLDLGAIAKGYAAGEALRLIAGEGPPGAVSPGPRGAVVNLGGNIALFGEKPGSSPWRIGIQDPLEERGAYLGVLEPRGGLSVVSSGVYERFFEEGGRRYHHLLSTETGYPLEGELLSVTVIGESCIDADALSTAVFALGYERGRELLRNAGAEGIFVFNDRRIRASPGARALFSLTRGDYRMGD
jgi:thiamine biosynthesis lipoprotein